MDRCLTENEIAQYAEYLCHMNVKPEEDVLIHVERCFHCKIVIFDICDLMDNVKSDTVHFLGSEPRH